jgi:hypothetical protein
MQLVITKGGVRVICDQIRTLQPKVIENLAHDETPFTPLLIEIISIAKRMHTYLLENDQQNTKSAAFIESANYDDQKMEIEDTLPLLQELLR